MEKHESLPHSLYISTLLISLLYFSPTSFHAFSSTRQSKHFKMYQNFTSLRESRDVTYMEINWDSDIVLWNNQVQMRLFQVIFSLLSIFKAHFNPGMN